MIKFIRPRHITGEAALHLETMTKDSIEECVDLFIDAFSKEPWNDEFQSRKQVVDFFHNHFNNNYFVGYILKEGSCIIAISIGMKKPWLQGMEYYIDQFCVKHDAQCKGIGSAFLRLIEADIKLQEMNAIFLNTEQGYPSEKFYLKNGFHKFDELVILAK